MVLKNNRYLKDVWMDEIFYSLGFIPGSILPPIVGFLSVSMLDVSIRAGILNLLKRLTVDMGLAGLYISHDLSLIRNICCVYNYFRPQK